MVRLFAAIMALLLADCGEQSPGATTEQAKALREREGKVCSGVESGTPDERMRACTVLVESRALPADVRALYYTFHASLWQGMRDYDRAIADYTEAIKLVPKDALNLRMRALLWVAKGDHDRALADYDLSLAIEPNAAAYYARGEIWLFYRENYDRAIAEFTAAIKVDPKWAMPYHARALARRSKGNKAGYEADMAQARKLDPNI